MKKLSFLLGVSVFALASCTSEDVVNPAAVGDGNGVAPIGFSVNPRNMGRDGSTVGLETVTYDFEVWAVKGNTFAAPAPAGQTVMSEYLVGWTDNTLGYVPTNGQNMFGTQWLYEGLGSTEYDQTGAKGYKWGGCDLVQLNQQYTGNGRTSSVPTQYLKYWDPAYTYTYFMACAPYGVATMNTAGDELTFTLESGANVVPPMYAKAIYSSDAKWTIVNETPDRYVNLDFERLSSQIRVAFFEEVEGYKVELIDFSTGNEGVGNGEMYMVPAKEDGGNYTTGQYTVSGTQVVKFSEPTPGTFVATAQTATGTPGNANITCPLWFRTLNGENKWADTPFTTELGTSKATAIYGGTYTVVPAQTGANANDGFTLNVSLKFTALDATNEVIKIYNARVFVPANFCQWTSNKLYTYIFRVTNFVGGQKNPGTVGPEPNRDYLVPIVFDQCSVTELDGSDWDNPWDLSSEPQP